MESEQTINEYCRRNKFFTKPELENFKQRWHAFLANLEYTMKQWSSVLILCDINVMVVIFILLQLDPKIFFYFVF